jgi:hypothetical protein
LGLFAQAEREESLSAQIENPPPVKREEIERDRPPVRKIQKYRTPQHLPVQRGNLFESRKRISALGGRPLRGAQSELMLRPRGDVGV